MEEIKEEIQEDEKKEKKDESGKKKSLIHDELKFAHNINKTIFELRGSGEKED